MDEINELIDGFEGLKKIANVEYTICILARAIKQLREDLTSIDQSLDAHLEDYHKDD
jgi:hypothetical protein